MACWRLAGNHTNLEMNNGHRNLALQGAHLQARRFIHERSKINWREVENNPRPIITVGFSQKQYECGAARRGGFDGRCSVVSVARYEWERERVGGAKRVMSHRGRWRRPSEVRPHVARCTRYTSRLFIIKKPEVSAR